MFDMDFLVPLEYADFSGLKSRSSCSFVVCLAVKQERTGLVFCGDKVCELCGACYLKFAPRLFLEDFYVSC